MAESGDTAWSACNACLVRVSVTDASSETVRLSRRTTAQANSIMGTTKTYRMGNSAIGNQRTRKRTLTCYTAAEVRRDVNRAGAMLTVT